MHNEEKYQDARKIQLMMHKYGIEDFKTLLLFAAQNAADDTEDLEDKSVHEKYNEFVYRLAE